MSSPSDKPPNRYHILVVEDDDQDWALIERALRKPKNVVFDAARVSHLNNALTALRHRRYDAVLLDLILQFDGPANGLDTVVQVVKEAPDTPILVLSSFGDIEMAVQAVEYGASAYIEKPPEPRRLESVLRQAIERHVRDEIARRLTWESLSKYADASDSPLIAAAIGGHLDNLEQGIHHIRSYLSSTAPQHAVEVDKILGWGHIMASLQEIRRVLRLDEPTTKDTIVPPSKEGEPARKRKSRAISERALQRIQDSAIGAAGDIKTPEDAKAYLLSLQTTTSSKPPEKP